MRHLSWIITIPVALLAISFAVSNRDPVELTLWPLPIDIVAPLYALVLGMLVVGFLAGGITAWVGAGRHRRAAKAANARAADLERELSALRERQAALAEGASSATPQMVLPPV